MGKYTGIIIVSDIDGTFLSRIPENYEKNVRAIEKFKSEGGIFTFATGRDFHSLISVVPDAEDIVNAPIIVANGAKLYDPKTKQNIIDASLNMPVFKEFIKLIFEKYPDIGVRFGGNDMIVVPRLNDMILDDFNTMMKPKLNLKRLREIPIDEIGDMAKCVIVHNPEILDDVQKMGEEFDKEQNFYFSKSYARGLEAVNKDYTKGKTTKKLKEYLNIPNGILYAVGDYYNDTDMISSADIGVCPENAVDVIKGLAKIITKSCDDGAIADLLDFLHN